MNKKIPMRQCVGCGEMKNKREMMRVLKTPEGPIVLDATGRKNGRGAYLCKSLDCLKKARKNRGLERSFQMSIPDEVYDSLENGSGKVRFGGTFVDQRLNVRFGKYTTTGSNRIDCLVIFGIFIEPGSIGF